MPESEAGVSQEGKVVTVAGAEDDGVVLPGRPVDESHFSAVRADRGYPRDLSDLK